MTVGLLIIALAVAVAAIIDTIERRVDDRAERERARALHHRLMGEIRRLP